MVIIGPPGAGKDTQGEFIAKKYRLKILSVGKILREQVKKGSKLGKLIKNDLESGNLVDDKIVDKILREKLKREKHVLIDGFPRDLDQAKTFSSINYALYIDCKREDIVKRLLKRAKVEGRKDDNKKTIYHRWNVFTQETLPVVEFYREKGILREVDGNKGIEEVKERTMDLLQQDKLFQRLLKGK